VILVDPVRRHIVNALYLSGKETAKAIEKLRVDYRDQDETGVLPDRVIADGEKTYVLAPEKELPAGR
jgi:hypothetical protein